MRNSFSISMQIFFLFAWRDLLECCRCRPRSETFNMHLLCWWWTLNLIYDWPLRKCSIDKHPNVVSYSGRNNQKRVFFFLMRTLTDLHVDLWNLLVEVADWCHYSSIRDERCFVQMSNESRRSPSISLCCTKADATFNITDRINEFLLLTAYLS